jgi:hypothetical protein
MIPFRGRGDNRRQHVTEAAWPRVSPLVTPTRCVPRLGPAVECGVNSAMAGPNRGRTVLPPLYDEGQAFVTGGGEGGTREGAP